MKSKSFNLLLKSMLSESTPSITVPELADKDLNKLTLLDAREKNEFEVSHLKNARWVGFNDFDLSRLNGIDKDTEIVIYCSIGVRSEKISEKIRSAGFRNVKNLYGSIFEWVNQGNPVYGPDGKQTQKVHAYNKKWGVWLNKGVKVYE